MDLQAMLAASKGEQPAGSGTASQPKAPRPPKSAQGADGKLGGVMQDDDSDLDEDPFKMFNVEGLDELDALLEDGGAEARDAAAVPPGGASPTARQSASMGTASAGLSGISEAGGDEAAATAGTGAARNEATSRPSPPPRDAGAPGGPQAGAQPEAPAPANSPGGDATSAPANEISTGEMRSTATPQGSPSPGEQTPGDMPPRPSSAGDAMLAGAAAQTPAAGKPPRAPPATRELLAPSLLTSRLQQLAASPEKPAAAQRTEAAEAGHDPPAASAPPSTPRTAPLACVPRLQLSKCVLGNVTPTLAGLSPASLHAASAGATPSTAHTSAPCDTRRATPATARTCGLESARNALTVRSLATPPATQRSSGDGSGGEGALLTDAVVDALVASVATAGTPRVAAPAAVKAAAAAAAANAMRTEMPPPPPPIRLSAQSAVADAAGGDDAPQGDGASMDTAEEDTPTQHSAPARHQQQHTFRFTARASTPRVSASQGASASSDLFSKRRADTAVTQGAPKKVTPRPDVALTLPTPHSNSAPPDGAQAPATGAFSASHKRKASVHDLGDLSCTLDPSAARPPQFRRDHHGGAMPILPVASVQRVEDDSPGTRRGSPEQPTPAPSGHAQPDRAPGAGVSAAGAQAAPGGLRQACLEDAAAVRKDAPQRIEDLADLNDRLQEMAINLETQMDGAHKVRVDVALANHRWAQLAQPLYFSDSSGLLDESDQTLAAVAAAHQESTNVAQSLEWL